MPSESPQKWVLSFLNSDNELNATELWCGCNYALDMSIVLNSDEFGLVIDNTLVLIIWPHRKGLKFRAMGDEWAGIAQQLMVMYANKLRLN
jgi:hypothetical protein